MNLRSLVLIASSLLLASCATVLHDFQTCSPYPPSPDTPVFERLGASCDNFLTHAPEHLTKTQWKQRQAAWRAKGWAIEVTHSQAIAWNKAELEKLCTVSKCSVEQAQAVAELKANLDRTEALGKRVQQVSAELERDGYHSSIEELGIVLPATADRADHSE